MMRLDLATDDFIGARSQQQDAAAARSIGSGGGAMLVLADGLGGHTGGAEASRIVVETFGAAADAGTFDAEPGRRPGLRATLEKANERIADGVEPAHGQRGMASTAVAVILADGLVNWISIGDSHLYVWRRGRLAKLNEDHSQAGLMVRSGQYKPDDPEVAAAKSVLVSALTGRKLEIVDQPAQAFAVEKGDVVLLASDGLNTLSEVEIESAVSAVQARGAGEVSTLLLDKVRERRADRQDNTAVVVACVVEMPERATEVATQLAQDTQRVTAPTEIASATLPPVRTPLKTPPAADLNKSAVAAVKSAVTKPDATEPALHKPAASKVAAAVAPVSVDAVSANQPKPPSEPPLPHPASLSGLQPGLIAKVLLGLALATAAAGTYLFWKPAPPSEIPAEKRSGAGKPEPALVEPPKPATPPAATPVVPAAPAAVQQQSAPDAARPATPEPTRTPGASETPRPSTGGTISPPPAPQLIEPPAQVGPRGSLQQPPQQAAPVRTLVPNQR